jgi:hypothetical protein
VVRFEGIASQDRYMARIVTLSETPAKMNVITVADDLPEQLNGSTPNPWRALYVDVCAVCCVLWLSLYSIGHCTLMCVLCAVCCVLCCG